MRPPGVEAERGEPGQKDARKVRRFIENARAAAPEEDEFGPDPEAGRPLRLDAGRVTVTRPIRSTVPVRHGRWRSC